jgi:hypothetical protein
VPESWLTTLWNHVKLTEIITDRDAEVLKHLVDVRLLYLLSETTTKVGYAGGLIYKRALETEIR